MAIWFKYYIGDTGPQLYRSKRGELPFRVQRVVNPRGLGYRDPDNSIDVALNLPSSIVGEGGSGNVSGTISAAGYAAFRAAHFNAFNIGGDLL